MIVYNACMRLLYTFLLYFATPFIVVRLLWRSLKQPEYRRRICERFAFFKPIGDKKTLWIHAVSVGETHAAFPLIRALQKLYPDAELVITTTTPTGSAEISKNFSSKITHVYTPYDLPSVIKRFLRKTHPTVCIIMETELWPNLLHYTRKKNIPILLANARLSERSLVGYQRIAGLTKTMLSCIETVAAQSTADGDRFLRLGLEKNKLAYTGNIKFDTTLPADLIENAAALRDQWQHRPTWIAASTHEGEEQLILEAHQKIKQQVKNALLILVPRHPQRFQKVAQLCKQYGMSMARRSHNKTPAAEHAIYFGDTMGELKLLYAASDIAFVGGSLMPIGGHNPIEPALLHIPVLSGPHYQNFTVITDLLINAKAMQIVANQHELAQTIVTLIEQPELREQWGERGYQVCAANTGALEKILSWCKPHLRLWSMSHKSFREC